MKVVTDCNVIIAAGLTNGTARQSLEIILKEHTNYISDDIVREYRDVILRPKFASYKKYLMELIEVVCTCSEWFEGEIKDYSYDMNDIDDKIYLNLALEVKANCLVTGNKKDFPVMGKKESLKIVTPKEFIELAGK